MGNRHPGVLGYEPLPVGFGPGGSPQPDGPFGHAGPVGTGGGTTPPASLTMRDWPRAIAWSEFRDVSERPEGETEYAQIHAEALQPDNVSVQRRGSNYGIGSISVRIRVDREQSWVVTARKSADLLSHEQGHFDIQGLMGRDMGNELIAIEASSTDELQRRVTEVIQRYATRGQELSDLYDEQTAHGVNRAEQTRWDDQIRNAKDRGIPFRAP